MSEQIRGPHQNTNLGTSGGKGSANAEIIPADFVVDSPGKQHTHIFDILPLVQHVELTLRGILRGPT